MSTSASEAVSTLRSSGGAHHLDSGYTVEARSWGPLLFAGSAIVAVAAAAVLTRLTGPGAAIILVAAALGLTLAGLSSPLASVLLVLLCSFLRTTPEFQKLPLQPFTLAFIGMVLTVLVAFARHRIRVPSFGLTEILMIFYVIWNIFSIILPHTYAPIDTETGQDLSVRRFLETGVLIPFALYLVGRCALERERAMIRLHWGILLLTAYSAAVSILQFTGPAAIVWPRYIVNAPAWAERAVGVFNQPVINGLLLVIGFVVALQLALRPEASRLQRVIASAVAVPTLLAVYLTHTRAVWLAMAAALVLGALFSPRLRPVMLAVTGAIALVVVTNWSTFTSSDRAAGGVASASEVDDRLNGIVTSIWAIRQEPIFGWGLGRFQQLNTYHHQQWAPDVLWLRGLGLASHENELGIGAELGLVGLALWLGVISTLLWALVRALQRAHLSGASKDRSVLGLIAMVVWLIVGTTVDVRYFELGNGMAMLLIGIGIGAGRAAIDMRGKAMAPDDIRPYTASGERVRP